MELIPNKSINLKTMQRRNLGINDKITRKKNSLKKANSFGHGKN